MTDCSEKINEPELKEESSFISQSTENIVKEIQEKDWQDEREHFSSRMYYLLAMVQICLSFNGIFGCPLASLNNGGIVFFIPYTIFTIILGYPIHLMECSLGQYSQLGPVKVWNCVPLARGIGLSCIFLCIMVAFYNNTYAAYAVMYFSRCFDEVLPWSDCDRPSFKNKNCVPRMSVSENTQYTPAQHYFFDHLLRLNITQHTGHYHFGRVVWQQSLAFVYGWFIVYLSLFQNIRSLERMLPIFVGIPLFCILLLLSIGLQLHGAFYAFKFLFSPTSFHFLSHLSTWCTAAQQVLTELGIAQGTLITYGSYAYHRNKTHLDSRLIICANYIISVGSSIIVWLFVGSLASEMKNTDSLPLHFKDFSYVYILFTESLGRLPGARIWCMGVFILIFSSCLNCQMAVMQTICCTLYDQFPQLLDIRCLINFVFCALFACFGVLLCTTNSWILLQSFHDIPNVLSRIPIASCTVAVIVLVYGINKYCEDLHFLFNYYPSFSLRLCFYVAPFLMLGLYISNWSLLSPFSHSDFVVFKFILYLILIWKPLGFLYYLVLSAVNGDIKDFWRSLEEWGPGNEKARIARAYFSSSSRVTLSIPWRKKIGD